MLPTRFIVRVWIVITLAGSLISVVAEIRRKQQARDLEPFIRSNQRVLVQRGAEAVAEGDDAWRRFLRDLTGSGLEPPFRLVILDAGDGIVAGVGEGPARGPAEPALARLGRRARGSRRLEAESAGGRLATVLAVSAPDGERYVVAARSPVAAQLMDTPAGELVVRHIAIVLLTTAACVALTGYSKSPLVSVRRVSRRLAGGDLSVRVPVQFSDRTDELGHMVRDFNAMADRLEVVIETQNRMLRDISHELRSPLSRLEIAVELARRHRASPEPLDRIALETHRLATLIGDLLVYARVRTRHSPMADAEIPLPKLVREVAADAAFEAAPRGVTVCTLQVDECTVTGNEDLLRSALENVLRNAVKYTREGTTVEVSVRSRAGRVTLVVRDQGPGVPPGELERIFDPFYRTDAARQRETGGAGLGLSIASQIVRAHHGAIRAFNERDGGLGIEIVLPLGKTTERPDEPSEESA